jgi:hypothetical protein
VALDFLLPVPAGLLFVLAGFLLASTGVEQPEKVRPVAPKTMDLMNVRRVMDMVYLL